jgi:hypothetical protein
MAPVSTDLDTRAGAKRPAWLPSALGWTHNGNLAQEFDGQRAGSLAHTSRSRDCSVGFESLGRGCSHGCSYFRTNLASTVMGGCGPSSSPAVVNEEHARLAHRWRGLGLVGGGYLLVSIAMWWHVWSNHPTSTSLCACGDTSLFTWFIEWPVYALSHGLNPLYSTAMGYPRGINLLANTGELAVGIPFAPITWIFGPIATLNVALTLSPVLSGMAMFVLLRRWVSWEPAAFVGGLLYGFSPFILTNLDYSHLNLTMDLVPPLVIICLDELFIRQQRRPMVNGVLLGLLVTLQFFLGTELLVITVIGMAAGTAGVIAYALWRERQAMRLHARFAVNGLTWAATTAAVLLAYPTWFALAGPAHLSGSIWPQPLDQYVANLHTYLTGLPGFRYPSLYGFNGFILSDHYLGIGLVVVLGVGLVAWRRDLRLWLCAFTGLVALALAQGDANVLFGRLPLLENVLPSRFVLIVYLATAIMLGLIVDHTHSWLNEWFTRKHGRDLVPGDPCQPKSRPAIPTSSARVRRPQPAWAGALGGVIVAAIAIVPIAIYLSPNAPIPVQPTRVPSWFSAVAPRLGPNQVLLIFPATLSQESPISWQALDNMRYSMVNEGGPGGDVLRAGKEELGDVVLSDISLPAAESTPASKKADRILTPSDVGDVRSALRAWGVTMVVIPDHAGLAYYEQTPSVPAAAALITAATGQRPVYQAGAWVWSAVTRSTSSIVTTSSRLTPCTSTGTEATSAVETTVACVATRKPFVRIVVPVDASLRMVSHIILHKDDPLVTMAAATAPITKVQFVITGDGIAGSLTLPAGRFIYGPLAGWAVHPADIHLPAGTYQMRSVAYDATGKIGQSPAVTVRVDRP